MEFLIRIVFIHSGNVKIIAVAAWLFYFLSVFFGLTTLNSLTGQLEPGDDDTTLKPSIWHSAVNKPMKLQWITFMLGLITSLVFGLISIFSPPKMLSDPKFTFPNSTINILIPDTSKNVKVDSLPNIFPTPHTDSDNGKVNELKQPKSMSELFDEYYADSLNFSLTYAKADLNVTINTDGQETKYSLPHTDSSWLKEQINNYILLKKRSKETLLNVLLKYKL